MPKTELTDWTKRAIESNPIEARLVRKIVKALKDAGTPIVSAYDGEDTNPVTDTNSILNEVFNLDEVRLYTKSGAGVFLVMGEEWDILADYNVSLEEALKPVNAYIEKHWD